MFFPSSTLTAAFQHSRHFRARFFPRPFTSQVGSGVQTTYTLCIVIQCMTSSLHSSGNYSFWRISCQIVRPNIVHVLIGHGQTYQLSLIPDLIYCLLAVQIRYTWTIVLLWVIQDKNSYELSNHSSQSFRVNSLLVSRHCWWRFQDLSEPYSFLGLWSANCQRKSKMIGHVL